MKKEKSGVKKVEKKHSVIEQILKKISIIDKINREWKEGKISEFEFSEMLDRLLVNIKRYQALHEKIQKRRK